jgi:hypothetical protein
MYRGIGRFQRHGRTSKYKRTLIFGTIVALLTLWLSVSTATAGRLIETGEVADVSCDTNPLLGGCHFLRVALDYVRSGAPNPSKPVLVFDAGTDQTVSAILAAYGGSPPFAVESVTPSAIPNFRTFGLTTDNFSAIVVASDRTAFTATGAGDLNSEPPPTSRPDPCGCGLTDYEHPWFASDPIRSGFALPEDPNEVPGSLSPFTLDSDALLAPQGHKAITDFYDGRGGILVLSGGDNGDGHQEDLYYDFVNAPRGQIFNGDPSTITALGLGIGFALSDIGHNGAGGGCRASLSFSLCPQNGFFPLPTGSSLKVAEVDNANNPVTLFQDTDPPITTITSAPPPTVVSRGPTSASFTFAASENLVTFECRLDGGGFTPCSSPMTYNNLSEGEHVFSVRATDAAGNVEAAPPATAWLLAFDRDGDGFTRFSNPPDCNDNDPSIYPGAPEARGGHVDSDCDGVIDPFLRIHVDRHLQVGFSGGSTVITSLAVTSVPTGDTVRIACAGRKHCPFRASAVTVKNGHAVDFTRLVHRHKLPPGLVVVVRVTGPQSIGFYWSETMGRPPALPSQSLACMNPGTVKPRSSCPSYSP